jgi:hypothetical protein
MIHIDESDSRFESCADCIHSMDTTEICVLRGCIHAVDKLVECFEPRESEGKE